MRFVLAIMLLCYATGSSQAQTASISATQFQLDPTGLFITFTGIDPSQIVSFRVFRVGDTYAPDANGHLIVDGADATSEYIDSAAAPIVGMSSETIRLRKPLENAPYLIVALRKTGAYLNAKIQPKGTIGVWDMRTANHELKVSSPVYMNLKSGQKVVIERSRATVDFNTGAARLSPVKYNGTVSFVENDGVFVKLDRNLPAGQTSSVSLAGSTVPADGKIDLSGAPKNDTDAYILAKASAVAAVHQAPVFTLSGNVAPFHPALDAVFWGPVRFDPSVVFDVGLRSTKTANSIIVPAPFSRTFLFGLPKGPLNGDYRDRPSTDPMGMTVSFGPRYETDRTFRRVNMLGATRAEFYLPQLSHSVEALQAKASAQSPKYREFVNGPLGGFQFTPYIEVDAGAHVNNETITNSTTHSSEIVPEHSIARFYGGLVSKIQFWRFQLSCDSSVVDMFTNETIGFTTSKGVALRRLTGVHPHNKPDFTVFIDQAHHYGLDITWENGRIAPNFEYLNTVNVGIKVIY
jgi:hypothetical protein